VQEIHVDIYPHLNSNNLFTNYADQPVTAPGIFYDASSTAILASTVYRAAVMLNQLEFIPFAEKTRQTLITCTSSNKTLSDSSSSESFDGYNHLTSDGRLTPVVDPYDIRRRVRIVKHLWWRCSQRGGIGCKPDPGWQPVQRLQPDLRGQLVPSIGT